MSLRFLIILAALQLGISTAAEPDIEENQADLKHLQRQISTLQSQLETRYKRQDRLQYQLRQNALQRNRLEHQKRTLRSQLQTQQTLLSELQQEHQLQSKKLATHHESLKQQLRLAHQTRINNRLTLAMNASDPAEIGRQFAYLDYLNRARTEKMGVLSLTLSALLKSQAAVQQQQAKILQQQQQLEQNRTALKAQKTEKSRLLATLTTNIHSESDQLAQLQRNETDLVSLIENLQQLELNDLAPVTDFAQQLGKLSWPVDGKIIVPYGQRRTNSRQRWSGTVLNPQADSAVHSVFAGRVVFSDWLRGFGLLLIVDHGDGYLSLYGYNNSLHKAAGDWVERTDVIATTGSDEQGSGRFYFEIRKGGKPQDPTRWCRG